jgi:two-component system OmpR family sensor kinase
MTLKRRLVATLLALLAAGLLASDIVTWSAMHSFLEGRVDFQLQTSLRQALKYLSFRATRGLPMDYGGLDSRINPDIYVEVLSPAGKILYARPSGSPVAKDPAPALPGRIPVGRVSLAPRRIRTYVPDADAFDVGIRHPSGRVYRVEAVATPRATIVMATSLSKVHGTLDSLLTTDEIVSAIVLLAAGLLAFWLVRIGLRPLDEMARTADAISMGDIDRRVPQRGTKSEVDRLAGALNSMLSQLTAAIAARSSSEEKLRRFVADASHELRTPLTAIRGWAELYRRGALRTQDSVSSAIRRIEDEAARMGMLLDDMLLLAQLDEGREIERQPVELASVMKDAVATFRVLAPDRSIEVVNAQDTWVIGDRHRLRQVIDNLLRNAIRHTPPGTRVILRCAQRSSLVSLEVEDYGPGLAPGEAEKVFDRFYRATRTRGDQHEPGEGVGLGLAIVAAIAKAHGGRAFYEHPGHSGARFVVELPALGMTPPLAPQDSAPHGQTAEQRGTEIPNVAKQEVQPPERVAQKS